MWIWKHGVKLMFECLVIAYFCEHGLGCVPSRNRCAAYTIQCLGVTSSFCTSTGTPGFRSRFFFAGAGAVTWGRLLFRLRLLRTYRCPFFLLTKCKKQLYVHCFSLEHVLVSPPPVSPLSLPSIGKWKENIGTGKNFIMNIQ